MAKDNGARKLDAAKVVLTLDHLRIRVAERFPDSGLAQVCEQLTVTARTTAQRARRLSRPYLGLRFLVLAVVLAAIVAEAVLIARLDWLSTLRGADALKLAQGLEPAVNLILLSGAAAWFLVSLETRWKRGRVQKALHELRSFAHVIDMHQLTKDPTLVLGPRTPSSPVREMNRFQLARYLDYCAEMLALTAKLAALYAGESDDPVIVAAVNDIETLTSDLGRKIWQKIMILGQLDRLSLTSSRNAKLTLIEDFLRGQPDPDRGFALAALTGALSFSAAKPAFIRKAIEARMDAQLFAWSYDYVGDLAETVALAWPSRPGANREPQLSEVIEALRGASRSEVQRLIEDWLDALDADGRWALLKLMTGGLRVGVSARLAKQACANLGKVEIGEIEEVWHALEPPYGDLFAWLEGRSERPSPDAPGRFRPVMLAQAIDEAVDFAKLDPADYVAEWKWDGIRVQAVSERGERRLYTRTGDDISATFPDVLAALDFDGALDGELVVIRDGALAAFSDLQQRLNRKTVDTRQLTAFPAGIRAYDLLLDGETDVRSLPFIERRARLEAFVARIASARIDLSPLQAFETWEDLAALRAEPPEGDARLSEGLMLKRRESVYEPGRPKGPWFKWKRDPRLIDTVLMYAQRGHGRRSSFYSDYTFGVWREDELGARTLTPVGKAYFGFTDEELKQIDKFVRDNTVERFGPVRSVRADLDFGLVFEVAFEGLQRSTRHKSGVAMRFPRINRIRWDKPSREADELKTLERLLD